MSTPTPTPLAFYAPMKPPDDPVPSGDRTFARALWAALAGAGPDFAPSLASRLRVWDGAGDAARQDAAFRAARDARAALPQPRFWLTYHNYYKAPDLLGPAAAETGAVYAIVEASRSARRRAGPWRRYAEAADAATARADVLFHVTERDRPALAAALGPAQSLVLLRPFLPREALAPPAERAKTVGPLRLLTVAMLRAGDKTASYRALAAALGRVRTPWRLDVVGDGPAEPEIRALLAPFGDAVRFLGRLAPEAVTAAYRAADLMVWPGVGEAFGLVYLEAQAEGLAALAEDRPGVRDVVRDGGVLTPPNDPHAFAASIDALAADPERRRGVGAAGRAQVAAEHLLGPARRVLVAGLRAAEARKREEAP